MNSDSTGRRATPKTSMNGRQMIAPSYRGDVLRSSRVGSIEGMKSAVPFQTFGLYIDWNAIKRLSLTEISSGLPAERLSRIARYVRPEDQYRGALTGHLINFLYQRIYPDRRPPDLGKGPYGKPEFREPGAPTFNVSHSGDWLVGIVGQGLLGIDVEAIPPVTAMIDDVLSPDEHQAIHDMSDDDRMAHFIRLWTLKEAHLKATGYGLAVGKLQRLCFSINADETARLSGQSTDLAYRSFLLDTRHACAICAPFSPSLPSVIGIADILCPGRSG